MSLKGEFPTVLFSIEIGTRELDSKLVMASALAKEGFRSIVGHKEALKAIARESKHVIWQGKSIFSSNMSNHVADDLIENGSAIMFLHDEGGIHQVSAWTENVLKKHRIDDLRKRRMNRVCVWGERQRTVIADFAGELSDALAVTGSPRFDLCNQRYSWLTGQQERDSLKDCLPYILVCTRFVNAAHAEGQHAPFVRRMQSEIWPESFDFRTVADVFFSQWQQAVHDFADLVVLVKEMALSHPDYTIVLRPHPSESLTFYQQAFCQFRNVVVRRDQSVLDWIRSAKLVVHSNCTTGVEAVLANCPVVNLLPAKSDRTDLDLEVAREAGYVANSVTDALARIDRILDGEAPTQSWSAEAKSILNNLTSESIPIMAKETAAVARESGISSSKVSLPAGRPVRTALRRVLRRSDRSAYVESKRSSLDFARVETVIAGCNANKLGAGSIAHMTKQFVVIEP